MNASVVFTWGRTIPGHEGEALAYGMETDEYFGGLLEQGRISGYRWLASPHVLRHDMLVVDGSAEALQEIMMSPESMRMNAKGAFLLQGFDWDIYMAGEKVQDVYGPWVETLVEFGIPIGAPA